MKTIRNIFIAVLFGIVIGFLLYIAPNYKSDENKGKTNLVINYSNVTSKMKGEVIKDDDGTMYLSEDDIKNYYDKYIYYDEQYNYIIVTANGKIACFDVSAGTLTINNEKSNARILKKDDKYYVPISKLEAVYNIDVKYITESDTLIIESLNKELKTATITKKCNIKWKNTIFSKSIENVNINEKVAIVPNKENKNYNGWTLVRAENGKIGYIKNEYLSEIKIERTEQTKEKNKISLVWEEFSKIGKAPQNDTSIKYDGINVVSPAFFYVEDSQIKENVGVQGINYINWAKSNNYQVWAKVANNSDNKDKMQQFSNVVNDYKKREEWIEQIINYSQAYKLDGINIDFENIYKNDKDGLSRFIIELKPRLENIGVILSVDVTEPNGSPTWSLCFDRNVIGDISDYIVFMGYDQFTKSSNKPGSTAAYNWVDQNIDEFINKEGVESNKLILAMPFYTILWKTNGTDLSGDYVTMENESKYIANNEIKWLEDEKQQYIEYNKNNYIYKMWIENEKSLSYKLDLISKYNLAGGAFWRKGYEDESIWNVIRQKIFE